MSAKQKPRPADDWPEARPSDNLPVPATRPMPTLHRGVTESIDTWHTNLDLTTDVGKAALVNAGNVPDWIPADRKTERMLAVSYVVCPAEYEDKRTGEIVQTCAIIFIGKDGKTARFLNEWSARRLHAMLTLFTPERWAEGIEIELYVGTSRREGQQYGSFRVIAKQE